MDDRVTELEVRVAFQEHQLAELDDVIRALRDEIDGLRRAIEEIRAQQPLGDEDPDQKPPHY